MDNSKKSGNTQSLDGITLEMMLIYLYGHLGWQAMASEITIRCFTHDPSIKSSLKFLRRTPWAKTKVEQLYLHTTKQMQV